MFESINAPNIIFTVINILILLIAMKFFLFKPIHKVIAKRQQLINDSVAEAEAMKASVAEMEREHRESLASVEEEKAAIIKSARDHAVHERDKIIEEAQEKAQAILNEAKSEAGLRKKEILNQTQSEISEIVVTAVEKLMLQKQAVGADDALYDEFLTKAGDDHDN